MVNIPTQTITRNGRVIGYKWGTKGKLYTTAKYGKKALGLANRQGRAIHASKARAKKGLVREHKRKTKSGKVIVVKRHRRKKGLI